jgi:hypothetical protein
MIWLLWKLLTLPIRVALLGLKLTFGTLRFVGVTRIAAFGAGVAAGRALASNAGVAGPVGAADAAGQRAGGDLGAAVRHELATSPRTWHLPQPTVTVRGDRVVLAGIVSHEQARLDLVRTAGALAGVRAVDDQLVVDGTAEGTEPGRS